MSFLNYTVLYMRWLVGLLCLSLPCYGQAGKAEVSGTIEDPAGLPVARATIEASEQSTGERFRTKSDQRGDYHLLGLPAGRYLLTVEQPGFRAYRQTGITLRLADQVRIDAHLELGQAVQSVIVNAEATLLQTANGAVTYNVGGNKIETLPLDGRNFIPLVALSPGVALPGGGSLLPRINGSRPRTNEYLYDGISVLQPEPGQVAFYPDHRRDRGIQAEYQLVFAGIRAIEWRHCYGDRQSPGSNDFHGTLFEFIRNEDLNARNYFAQPGPKPEFRRNQYGLTVGGPIRKNKTFFFADWQGTRLLTGVTRFSTVPTLAQRGGRVHRDNLRSCDIAANAVPRQHDSRQPVRSDRASGTAALSAAKSAGGGE